MCEFKVVHTPAKSVRAAVVSALIIAASLVTVTGLVHAQQGDGSRSSAMTHVFKPAKVPVTSDRIAQIKAPEGFKVSVFAEGLKNARVLVVGLNGTVYVSRRDQGDVLMLKDADGDGKADGPAVTVANRAGAHGLAIKGNKFYLVTVKQLFVADILDDGRLGPLTMLAGDLPDAGQHANRTIAFGPDGMLYMSVGSTCNACNEDNPENATILRISPDGKQRTIVASGLRNTIGFDWNPITGDLWGMDHGIDFLGDEQQPEELNLIEAGKQYGWPHVFGSGAINAQSTPPGDITKEQWKSLSEPMVLGYDAHAAPMQMLFYRGSAFPESFRSDAYVTFRGSWNRERPSGYEIVRIRFSNGKPTAFETFISGFLTDNGTTHIARPMGLAVASDGAMLIGDDANGVIYRIAYDPARKASGTAASSTTASSTRPLSSEPSPPPDDLVIRKMDGKSQLAMSVRSSSFAANGPLAAKFTEYADAVSPELAWTAITDAKSYAVVLQDPDSRPVKPFVHWVAWNIPAGVTRLPEGLQKQARLTDPDGLLQGRTTRGSVGYFGPRPPVGDPSHHYHFQVFALDKILDVAPGAPLDQVMAAMKGHVLGKGEVTGTYRQTHVPQK